MGEITSVQIAIKKADEFINPYYFFRRLEGAKKVEDVWVVEYDVSILGPKEIVKVKLDSTTGDVIEYTKSNKQ